MSPGEHIKKAELLATVEDRKEHSWGFETTMATIAGAQAHTQIAQAQVALFQANTHATWKGERGQVGPMQANEVWK